ncbi:MAG: glycosyltransferase, partial [Nitrospira sp.]|nr:glycosyltransferase [Nitrospira sp.]
MTVLVPCRNEADFIERCLTSILSNGYPADRLGVLVVDGRSEDGTRSVLGAYAQRHACVRVIDNPGRT